MEKQVVNVVFIEQSRDQLVEDLVTDISSVLQSIFSGNVSQSEGLMVPTGPFSKCKSREGSCTGRITSSVFGLSDM